MPFLLAEILNFQGSTHRIGVGSFSKVIIPFQIDDEMLTKPFNFRLTNVQRIEAFHNLEQAYDQLLGRIGVQTGLTR